MSQRLTPYGLTEYTDTVAKVGKFKVSQRLAARMPSAEVAAKVGQTNGMAGDRGFRLVRRNAR